MSDFAYANARLRAMKSRLLSSQTLSDLANAADVTGMLNRLTNSPYRESIELALVSYSAMAALRQGVQQEFYGRLGLAKSFFKGSSAELVRRALLRFDVENLKTVLRGLTQGVAPEMIADAIVPLSNLTPADWIGLAQSGNSRQAVDLLASWQATLAQPLLMLRAERPGASLFQWEMALERWLFTQLTSAPQPAGHSLADDARLRADVTNVLTSLRLAGLHGKEAFLSQQFGTPQPLPLFLGPGRLPFELLQAAASQESPARAIELLIDCYLGGVLSQALAPLEREGQLSVVEKSLRRFLLQKSLSYIVNYPLGIGVYLGYLELSRNEMANLYRIGHGLFLRQPASEIQEDLLLLN